MKPVTTEFMDACFNGDLNRVVSMVKNEKIDVNYLDAEGYMGINRGTVLHMMASKGHRENYYEISEFLILECEANPEIRDRNGCTALQVATRIIESGAIFATERHKETFKKLMDLLENYKNVRYFRDIKRNMQLLLDNNNYRGFEKYLKSNDSKIISEAMNHLKRFKNKPKTYIEFLITFANSSDKYLRRMVISELNDLGYENAKDMQRNEDMIDLMELKNDCKSSSNSSYIIANMRVLCRKRVEGIEDALIEILEESNSNVIRTEAVNCLKTIGYNGSVDIEAILRQKEIQELRNELNNPNILEYKLIRILITLQEKNATDTVDSIIIFLDHESHDVRTQATNTLKALNYNGDIDLDQKLLFNDAKGILRVSHHLLDKECMNIMRRIDQCKNKEIIPSIEHIIQKTLDYYDDDRSPCTCCCSFWALPNEVKEHINRAREAIIQINQNA